MFREVSSARIKISCADIERILQKLTHQGIILHQVHKTDAFSATIHVDFKDYKEALMLLNSWQVTYSILDKSNSDPFSKSIISRSVIIIGMILVLVLAMILPGRILFVHVNGNSRVPTRLILEIAGKKGVAFGASSSVVRSEKVKNALLEAIPELKWVGINTTGCVATINVQESIDIENKDAAPYRISSMVASTDGVISSCIVTKGNMLCKTGQAVTEGQTLISGYTDCGIIIKATQAEGEIYANTRHETTGIMPICYSSKASTQSVTSRYSLRIGKKLLKFNNSSGIYGGSCAKIRTEYSLSLPGGFVLPVSIVKETVTKFDQDDNYTLNNCESRLELYCREHICDSMIAGFIKAETAKNTVHTDTVELRGDYVCYELISRRKPEDILQGEFRSD